MCKSVNKYFSRAGSIAVTALALSFSYATNAAEDTGKEVFIQACESCHSGGFKGWVSGAPAIGEKEDWQKFFKQGEEKMTETTIKGGEGMDPMGGCKTCSNEQIAAAVKYIVSQTK